MPQGLLPFKYELERREAGLTALGGLGLYLDLFKALKLDKILDEKVGVRCGDQGYRDSEIGLLLILLNIIGGDSVEDLERLEADDGFSRLWGKLVRQCEVDKRMRGKASRNLPSATTIFRYLDSFHESFDSEVGRAMVPEGNEYLRGLQEVNRKLMARVQRERVEKRATLDCDATVVRSWKDAARYTYLGGKGYQPLSIFWHERELVLHTEFRDGNVPASYEVLRVVKEALALLPAGVIEVFYRSDGASYQHDLLGYLDDMDGGDAIKRRFGRIGFAVSCPVTEAFRMAIGELAESEWRPLDVDGEGKLIPGGREWAEVCYVPNELARKKRGREYRYFVTRQELAERPLPGMEDQLELPFPVMEMKRKRYKVFGVVANLGWEGDKIIRWHDGRCGKCEESHGIMKNDLAGGKFPSAKFGANAAWWWFATLAFNVQSIIKRVALDEQFWHKRLKAIRFHLIHLPARVLCHANRLIVRIATRTDIYEMLLRARSRIMALARAPATG